MARKKKVEAAVEETQEEVVNPLPIVPSSGGLTRLEDLSAEEVSAYEKEGKLVGFNEKANGRFSAVIKACLILALVFSLGAEMVYAASSDESVLGNKRWSVQNDGDLVPQSDSDYDIGSSSAKVQGVYASSDITFRTNLLANGRYNGNSLELQSSSTPIGSTQLAYAVITKRIGGAGGLDETNGGTRLANGTPGQTISLITIYREGTGTWIITPVTKTGFSTITMDAVGEHATLLYVNDTVGWVIVGSNATIA